MQQLASKIIKVMDDCHYVEKDKANAFHKYRYASAEAILSRVNAALVSHGIATFAKTEILSSETLTTAKGSPEKFVTARVVITLVDAQTGEAQEISGMGSGQDVGDKAIAKAQTMATKYAWITSLCIATGDDPEEDEDLDRRLQESAPKKDVLPQEVPSKKVEPATLLKRVEKVRSQRELQMLVEEARAANLLPTIGHALWIKRAQLCKTAKDVEILRDQMERANLPEEAQTQIMTHVPSQLLSKPSAAA